MFLGILNTIKKKILLKMIYSHSTYNQNLNGIFSSTNWFLTYVK